MIVPPSRAVYDDIWIRLWMGKMMVRSATMRRRRLQKAGMMEGMVENPWEGWNFLGLLGSRQCPFLDRCVHLPRMNNREDGCEEK
jgi:hypothetical protein